MGMTHNAEPFDNLAGNRAWYEHEATSQIRWLRAGGRLEELANNTLADVHFAIFALDLQEGDTVVNLNCGWGRHAMALGNYGLNVIGLDASADMLQLARETSQQAGIAVRWVHGDLNDLDLTEPVDAVVQFRDNLLDWADGPADALHLLDQLHAILKRDGRILFGTPDWRAEPPSQEQSLAATPEGQEIYRTFFDQESRRAAFQTVVIGRDGTQREYWRRNWSPTAEQMAALLFQAEFDVEGQFNDFDYLPYDPDQPGLVWLAQKAL
jgi:SAM-dependent methyltransferase